MQLVHLPHAHTDGDVMVFFRKSDVLVAGDVYVNTTFPVINVAQGGSINGILAALNRIIDITVPRKKQEGGTYVIPGHGRLADEADVVEYRDMVTIIRDRFADAIKRGQTLEQVKAARLVRDYEGRYGAAQGFWTTDAFVEAVYRRPSGGPAGDQGGAVMAGRVVRGLTPRSGCGRSARARADRRVAGGGAGPAGPAAGGAGRAAAGHAAAPRADRSDRLLGVDRQRGLALAHGDAAEGRRGERAAQPRGDQGGQRVGSGQRRLVPGLRSGGADAHADAPEHHMGGRPHHQDRNRRRAADTPPAVRRRHGRRAQRSLQGHSVAQWEPAPQPGRGGGPPQIPRFGNLRVTTTNLSGGWLRKNGVPYSEDATVTEYFDRFEAPNSDEWLVVTTIVSDPKYLNQDFVTSSHFKKEANGAKWSPAPCKAS